MTVLDTIREYAGYLGVAGGGVAAEIYRRFRRAEALAKQANKKAGDAIDKANEAITSTKTLAVTFDQLRHGFRLEVTQFKDEIENRINAIVRGSRPDQIFDQRQIDELGKDIEKLHKICDELKQDMLRERGQRHALQKDIQERSQKEAESWRHLERTLGRIETTIEMLKTHPPTR
jgi:predicted  nucleic acid-binding Zn-ribbon protein